MEPGVWGDSPEMIVSRIEGCEGEAAVSFLTMAEHWAVFYPDPCRYVVPVT